MTIEEAQIIVSSYLADHSPDCDLLPGAAEEHAPGFIFYYNSREYLRTRDWRDALLGNGPLLVLRDTGELIVLPSWQSAERSLQELDTQPLWRTSPGPGA